MNWRRRGLTRRQVLEAVPLRNPNVRWEELESGRLMAIYRRDARGLSWLWVKLLCLPEVAQVVLDERGTRVMGWIDGTRTVEEIITLLAEDLQLDRKESEIHLFRFLEMLGKRRLIGFAVPSGVGEEG